MKILVLKCWTYALEEEENFVVEVMLTLVSFIICITVLFGLSLDLSSLIALSLKENGLSNFCFRERYSLN